MECGQPGGVDRGEGAKQSALRPWRCGLIPVGSENLAADARCPLHASYPASPPNEPPNRALQLDAHFGCLRAATLADHDSPMARCAP
jgi:hypothetical protein